jgi:CDP-glycerol glycerophosphotransferase (TagB/SpsB family)
VPYFAVSKTAPQYAELKRLGRVVVHGSFRYKQLFLLADKVISSHFDEYVINPLGNAYYQYTGLTHSDYVYLEHGVLAADLSERINRFKKNIALIATASEKETNSIVTDKHYGYTADRVTTTGHPRFDGLKSRPKGKLVIMPTWRLALAPATNTHGGVSDGTRSYSKQFKESAYFKFYNNLINDERIIQALKSHNMTGEFYTHPNHSAQWKDYRGNDAVTIMPPPHNYEKGLSEGSIMLTDYSGLAFDFAYMQKPVVYAQFDRDTFYNEHAYNAGYFSFEVDGFGPVTHDYEATIKAVLNIITNNCQTSEKYRKRAERFFFSLDQQNSKRVYEAILDVDNSKTG